MTDAERHRGPDAGGFWEEVNPASGQGVVLGHRRLSIIDLSSAANQPMLDATTGNALVLNGEIYNFRELRSKLSGDGFQFHTQSDTEVLLRSYARWGADCVDRLRGMFAFAIWDPKARRVLLARDHLGIKPLYWTLVEEAGGARSLLFASELRAVLASGLVARYLDPSGVLSYLWNGFVVGPSTIARGIQLLAAGTILSVELDAVTQTERRYWQVPAAHPGACRVEDVAEALADAVALQLVSDVPLGVFLSGGIDSSAVTRLAAKASVRPIETFTIGFEEVEFDESAVARRVADAIGTSHHEIRLSEGHFIRELPSALASLDQPTFDAINTYFVSRAAREAGITVALAGTGGDELFGGYRSFVDLPRGARTGSILRPFPTEWLRRIGNTISRSLTSAGEVPPQTRWGKLADVLAAKGDLLRLYQVSYGLFTEAFGAELREIVSDGSVIAGLPRVRFEELRSWTRGEPILHAISMLETLLFLGERLLRDTDAASMAVALEVRVPILDHIVVERLAGLRGVDRFEPVLTKRLLRRIALSGLDPALFDRPKSGFVLPIERWTRQLLRDDLAATLGDASLCAAVGLRADAVCRLWRAYDSGAPGLYWSRVWALFVLLRWCQSNDLRV